MTRHRPTSALRRLVRVWHDLDYAQRRMFEMRTGVSAPDRWQRRF